MVLYARQDSDARRAMESLQGFILTPTSANAFSTLRSKSTWRVIGFSLIEKLQEPGDFGNVGELRHESSDRSCSVISVCKV